MDIQSNNNLKSNLWDKHLIQIRPAKRNQNLRKVTITRILPRQRAFAGIAKKTFINRLTGEHTKPEYQLKKHRAN